MMNKLITERDRIELSSFWAYQKLHVGDKVKVNSNLYKVVDEEHGDKNKNISGSIDLFTFELLERDTGTGTGQQFIAFQGTDNTEKVNPNNPLRAIVADDWLENLKLMNNKYKTTPLLKQGNDYMDAYNQKIKDAKTLSDKEFFKKHKLQRMSFYNKTLVGIGGNSQGVASAIYQGIQHRDIPITGTNGAMLPLSSFDYLGVPYYKNIIRYHSNYDILSWIQDPFVIYVPSKRVNIENGVPTLDAMISNHLGYKRNYNKSTGSYKNLPVHSIASVKDYMLIDGMYVPVIINIMVEMDDRIPINVWTGDAISVSGESGIIRLDIENLQRLANMVTGEMSTMLSECVKYLNESFNISEKENLQFDSRKYELKEHFEKEIKLDEIQNWIPLFKCISKEILHSLEQLMTIYTALSMHTIFHSLASFEICQVFETRYMAVVNQIDKLLNSIYETLEGKIDHLFKNIDHDMKDGVPEEIMQHLSYAQKGINKVKNQNDTYGQQIHDCQSAMTEKDATVMSGDFSVPNIGSHMVTEVIEASPYMTRKMSILKNHIDAGIKDITDYIQALYDNYGVFVMNEIEELEQIISNITQFFDALRHIVNTPVVKALAEITFLPIPDLLRQIEQTDQYLDNLNTVLQDSRSISPILQNHLGDILTNMKPLIIQMIFEPSHYDDMFILNKQAQSRLDQMAQQLQVVINGLDENEGAAIRALDTSASTIQTNINKINVELNKLSLY